MSVTEFKTQPEVPIRHMEPDFDESEVARYCADENAWYSACVLTFSALLLAGERFIIDSVRDLRDQIDDPKLRHRATERIDQGATRSRIHRTFNELYALKGLPMRRIEELSYNVYVGTILPRLSARNRLAIACGIEHMTTVVAAEVLGSQPEEIESLDQTAREFLAWRLLKELEDKSVAFDIYKELGGGSIRRILALLGLWAVSIPLGVYSVDRMLKTPGFDQGLKDRREGYRRLWNFFLDFSPRLVDYFRPDFHPDNINTSDLVEAWKEKLVGKKGALARKVARTVTPDARQYNSTQRLTG